MKRKDKYISLSWSKLSIIIGLLTTLYIVTNISYWRSEKKIIQHDVISYYSYLPSIFIYSDPSMSFINETPKEVKIWARQIPGEGKIIKMNMGLSFCYTPFFAIAHSYSLYSNKYKANGFSTPYRFAIAFAVIFYLALSLIFLRKLLLKYFSEFIVFWCLLSLAIGTNVLNYSTTEPGMGHVYSMALISASLYLYDRWLVNQKNKYLYLLGFLIGWICLIRATNVIVVLFMLLYKVGNLDDLKDRFKLISCNIKPFLIAIGCSILVLLPQLLFWKYNSGKWIYSAYSEGGEHFFFDDPKILSGLFSYRKGWLLYTPIMVFSILGLFIPNKYLINMRWNFIFVYLLQFYIIFSWWCWYYGGSFGMRAMIDFYPIAIIPFASFLSYMFSRHLLAKVFLSILLLMCMYLNIFQTYQYRNGLIHHSAMTKEAYWSIFLKHEWPKGWWNSIDEPDPIEERKGNRDL